jgi:hypothetical protein
MQTICLRKEVREQLAKIGTADIVAGMEQGNGQ